MPPPTPPDTHTYTHKTSWYTLMEHSHSCLLHVLSPLQFTESSLSSDYHKQRNRLRQTRQHPYNPRISNGVNTAFHKLQTHAKHALNFMHCEDSFFFFFFFFLFLNPPNQTRACSFTRILVASQRGVLPPVRHGASAAFSSDSEMYAIKPY